MKTPTPSARIGTAASRSTLSPATSFLPLTSNHRPARLVRRAVGSSHECSSKSITPPWVITRIGSGFSDRLSPAVLHQARRCLVDWLAVTLAGQRHPSVDILIEHARLVGGARQATLLGRGVRTSAPLAAMVNAQAAHVLDFEEPSGEYVRRSGNLISSALPGARTEMSFRPGATTSGFAKPSPFRGSSVDSAPGWRHYGAMARGGAAPRRPRLYVDVTDAVWTRVKQTADRLFRGAISDAVMAALTAFDWMLEQKREGKRVIAVEPDALPQRYSEAVLPGVDEALRNERWTWLVERPHPWRRQLWIKGRRIRAAEIVGDLDANGWTPEEAARQFDLPVDAVLEAQRYVEADRELIDAEMIEEQRIAQQAATAHPPDAVHATAR